MNRYAFTLVELLAVIFIIAILAGLILQMAGYIQKKGATARATAEIAAISAAMESYKADFGDYPRTNRTDSTSIDTSGSAMKDAIADLTVRLCGVGAIPQETLNEWAKEWKSLTEEEKKQRYPLTAYPIYFTPQASIMGDDTVSVTLPRLDDSGGSFTVKSVRYFTDPFGYPYGYDTTPANNPTFDLWSTGGSANLPERWIKNW